MWKGRVMDRLAVSLSGGKDSLYLLWRAKMRYGNPLAICVDTGFMSPVALRNVARATDQLGVDCIIVRSHKSKFAAIYYAHLDTMAENPFSVCHSCHEIIERVVSQTAAQMGCSRVWSGLSPDNGVLLPEGYSTEDFERGTGTEIPLCHAPYDPKAVRKIVARQFPGIVTSPLKTNCAINYILMNKFSKAHGWNPYNKFFAQHGRLAYAWWRVLDWLAMRSGYMALMARRAIAKIGEL